MQHFTINWLWFDFYIRLCMYRLQIVLAQVLLWPSLISLFGILYYKSSANYFCHFHEQGLSSNLTAVVRHSLWSWGSKEQGHLSHDLTKPTKWVCAQQRIRSAWASAQSDPESSLSAWRNLGCLATHSAHSKLWSDWVDESLPGRCPGWSKSSLGGCPGWSESSLGTHSFCWFCHVVAHLFQGSKWIKVYLGNRGHGKIKIFLSENRATKFLISREKITPWEGLCSKKNETT